MGSHIFNDVTIPLLWGSRAVVQDTAGRLSVIDLSAQPGRLEILGDKVAPGVPFAPRLHDDFAILSASGREELYSYSPREKRLVSLKWRFLPNCEILPGKIILGTNTFMGGSISGFGVGIGVSEDGSMFMGGPLPPGLAAVGT